MATIINEFPILGKKITVTSDFADNNYEFTNTSNSITIIPMYTTGEVEISIDGGRTVCGYIPYTSVPGVGYVLNVRINKIAFRSSTANLILYLFVG